MFNPTNVVARPAHGAARPEAHDPAHVRLDRVTKRFPGGVTAVDAVDLVLGEGEITVLVGPSGCGKTTILRLIAGFEQPTKGTLEIGGRAMAGVDPQDRGVAMVFQDYALYPDKTARANIEFPLRMAHVPRAERRARAEEIARLLRISEQLDRKPAQLSGGQRQRVGIGRALVRDPQVLLMDEPLSNLDAQLRTETRAELLALQRRLGVTTLYVTHDQAEALTMADQLAVIRDGRVEQVGPPKEVYGAPATSFVAEFVGGMNLIRGHRRGERLALDSGHTIRLPLSQRGDPGEPLVLGVRSEELCHGAPRPNELGVSGRVRLVEYLGVRQLVHLDLGGIVLRAQLPADVPPADHMPLRAPASAVHLFSANGGHRIDA